MSETDTLGEDPSRLLELDCLLDEAPAPLSRAKHEALFRGAIQRAKGRTASPRPLRTLAFAAACLVGAVSVTVAFKALRAPAEVQVAGPAELVQQGRTLTITAGKVTVQPRAPLTVRAGFVEVFVSNARVAMDVTSTSAALYVESGEVIVRDGATERHVTAGQRFESKLEMPASRSDACAHSGEGCLTPLAAGDGLEAETALYELALAAHERGDHRLANQRFEEHQRRFFDGVLAPEASLGLMLGHLALGDRTAAAAEAARFLSRFPADPRAAKIRALAH